MTDPKGHATATDYDRLGHKVRFSTQMRLPGGLRTVEQRWGYDEVYNVTSETTQRGDGSLVKQTRAYLYDKVQRQTKRTDERGGTVESGYDDTGNKTTEKVMPSGPATPTYATSLWEYDGANRVTATLPTTRMPSSPRGECAEPTAAVPDGGRRS